MLQANEIKPLQPLESGNILIVGLRSSILSEEIRTNPRVVLWDSEQEHWTNKELPQNVRVVFFGRFIGHTLASRIIKEARKRHITIFNNNGGTGLLMRQVRELIAFPSLAPASISVTVTKPVLKEETKMTEPVVDKTKNRGKLIPLRAFVDLTLTNKENEAILMKKVGELGIPTTAASISQFIVIQRRKAKSSNSAVQRVKVVKLPHEVKPKQDVSLDMLDLLIKELQDMRDFIAATVEENKVLKLRVERFKKALEGID